MVTKMIVLVLDKSENRTTLEVTHTSRPLHDGSAWPCTGPLRPCNRRPNTEKV